ncbi:hypothetical protein HG444_003315 [Candidatus Saccharibacteria bacterium]|nr:hypothetical protein [Candidatus Saccharibacteria bacterium]
MAQKTKLKHRRTPRAAAGRLLAAWRQRTRSFLSRRPHRSFKPTSKYDYKRSMELPGYIDFTWEVVQLLWQYRRPLLLLTLLFAALSTLATGAYQIASYENIRKAAEDAAQNTGNGQFLAAGYSFLTLFTSNFTGSAFRQSEVSTLLGVGSMLFLWLSVLWFIRHSLAHRIVRVRDAVFRSGGPVVALMILQLIALVQLIPGALGVTAAIIIMTGGGFDNVIIPAFFCIAAGLLVILSLYWITQTVMACVIITLPDIYPLRAMRLAGDLVTSRRLRIALRMLWSMIMVVLAWVVALYPVILLFNWLRSMFDFLQYVPFVSMYATFLSGAALTFVVVYTYLLYRKIVSDNDPPA